MIRDSYKVENDAPEALENNSPPLRLIATEAEPQNDGDIEVDVGQDWPLLPDGDYTAKFLKQEIVSLRMFKGSTRLFARFDILDSGNVNPVQIYGAWPILVKLNGGKRRISVSRNSNLYIMLCRVFSYRIRPERVSLQSLKGCVIKVRTRTVKKNFRQRVLPECLCYSVVDDIISIEAGSV